MNEPGTASRTDLSRRAFILTEDDVSALAEILLTLGPVELSVDCSDGFTRHFQSAEELKRFDNSPSRAIRALQIASEDAKTGAYAAFNLRNMSGSSVMVMCKGPADI